MGTSSRDWKLGLPGRVLWLEPGAWPALQAFCPLSNTSPHIQSCASMYCVHLWGRLHLSTSGVSCERVIPMVSESAGHKSKSWASCISLCGLFSCGLGNLILTQSLIWEATSTVLFYFSHWGIWNHDEAYLNQRVCIETHLYYICNFIW